MRAVLLALLLVPAYAGAGAQGAFVPSSRLDWTITADKLAADCDAARSRADSALQQVVAQNDLARTFANTPQALEAALDDFYDATGGNAFLKDVAVSSTTRQAARDCQEKIDKFLLDVFNREGLYKAVKAYADKKETLKGEDKKLLEKELLDFKKNGLALDPAKRAQVKKIKERLVEIQQAFSKNLGEVKDTLLVTREELAGLPEDYVNRLDRDGEKFKVTVDYPDYFPFMENSRSASARKRLQFIFDNRASESNEPLFKESLRLRRQAAELLGYPSHADFVLQDRMAKEPAAVKKFLASLRAKLKPLAKEELKVLQELKAKEEGAKSDGIIHEWDWRFYDNLLKKERFSVDQEQTKEYFPLETVVGGMFDVYQNLLGVKFREVPAASAWHPDVKLYEITDAAGGPAVAYFYLDLFPRDGKYKHAAAFNIVNGRTQADGSYQKPVAAMVCNFPKSTAEHPSLLKHGAHQDVETIFHEFGHIMHMTLTKATYERFAGTTAWDFVEAPSQMLENWVWDPQVLAQLSGSYKDPTKKLPDDLLKRMIAAKNADTGLIQLRQVFFAEVDMAYHGERGGEQDPTALWGRLMKEIRLIAMQDGTQPEASFGHLMDGYDAGYYGYLWSKVYAQDMFSRFETEGLLNPVIGRLYREQVLAPGAGADELGLVRQFLGREPNDAAFLKSLGLSAKRS